MNLEERLQHLENCLLKLDSERVSLLREIQVMREEINRTADKSRPLLGRPIAYLDLSTNGVR